MNNNILNKILLELVIMVAPAAEAASDPIARKKLFRALGWEVEKLDNAVILDLINAILNAKELIEGDLLPIIKNPPQSFQDYIEAFEITGGFFEIIKDLKNAFLNTGNITPSGFENFAIDLLNLLVINHLKLWRPTTYHVLFFLGIISGKEEEALTDLVENANGEWIRGPIYLQRIRLPHLSDLISDPLEHFKNTYFPDSGVITTYEEAYQTADKLFPRLSSLLKSLGIQAFYTSFPDFERLSLDFPELDDGSPSTLLGINYGSLAVNKALGHTLTLVFPSENESLLFGASLQISPVLGLVVVPFGNFTYGWSTKKWEIDLEANLAITGFSIKNNGILLPGSVGNLDLSGEVTVSRRFEHDNNSSIGGESGTHLNIGQIVLHLFFDLTQNNTEYGFYTEVKEGIIKVSPSDGDGFISKILPANGLETKFDFALGWSKAKGFHFAGSAGLQLSIPVNTSNIKFLDLKSIDLKILAAPEGLLMQAATSGSVKLGPITATVTEIGLKTDLTFPEEGGNLGVVNADLGFKLPSGIGLSIDAKGFSGGGYLYIGEHRYTGILNLNFNGGINFTAIGIITTRLPSGEKGFSLLIIITVDGFQPIQLGMGFTLNGIGGLLGLHRTMNLEVLRDGIRTGAVESILFPPDPVQRIDVILNDLESAFPVAEDRFVFGPMFKLGWGGAKAIVEADLGLFIEVFKPIKIAIAGVIRAIIPEDEEEAPLVIKVSFLGTFEPEKKMIAFDASIFASRLMKFTLEGDMAFRLLYGEHPNFVMSVGGFHPAYQPPPLQLPKMKRLTVSILNENKAKVFLEAYFAITSNTVQVGAYVEARFRAMGYDVLGYLGFDALFQFNPFMFVLDVRAGFGVYKKGKEKAAISVALHLEGPTPWQVSGKASVKILGIKFRLNFNKRFGEKKNTTLPDVDIQPLLEAELQRDDNWRAVFPEGSHDLIKIRRPKEADGLVVNPAGTFVISQKLAPLKKTLQKFGNQKPIGANYFEIEKVTTGGAIQAKRDVEDQFAPAQFEELTDTQKLSRPSFSNYKSGIKVAGSDEIQLGHAVKRDIYYETILIDGPDRIQEPVSRLKGRWLDQLQIDSAVGQSSLARANKSQHLIQDRKIRIREETFRIVRMEDFMAYTTDEYTETAAWEQLQEILQAQPELEDELEIVPSFELDTEPTVDLVQRQQSIATIHISNITNP